MKPDFAKIRIGMIGKIGLPPTPSKVLNRSKDPSNDNYTKSNALNKILKRPV
jgi:hypothetical protein